MAPCRVQIVLALELEAPWRPTNCTTGDTQAYPRDEHCQSAVGSAADPPSVAQARHRCRTDECGQIFWSKNENDCHKVVRRSCSIALMGSMRLICSSCRQSRFACSMDCRSWGTADDRFYGLASQLIQLRSGSQIRSRQHAAGNRTPWVHDTSATPARVLWRWESVMASSALRSGLRSTACMQAVDLKTKLHLRLIGRGRRLVGSCGAT